MKSFQELVDETIDIARVWGLHDQSNEDTQKLKCFEEILEVMEAETDEEEIMEVGDVAVCIINANWYRNGNKIGTNAYPEEVRISDVTGYVTEGQYSLAIAILFNYAYNCLGIHLNRCLEKAVEKNKKKKGMLINKFFVKYDSMTEEQKKEYHERDSGNALIRGV